MPLSLRLLATRATIQAQFDGPAIFAVISTFGCNSGLAGVSAREHPGVEASRACPRAHHAWECEELTDSKIWCDQAQPEE